MARIITGKNQRSRNNDDAVFVLVIIRAHSLVIPLSYMETNFLYGIVLDME